MSNTDSLYWDGPPDYDSRLIGAFCMGHTSSESMPGMYYIKWDWEYSVCQLPHAVMDSIDHAYHIEQSNVLRKPESADKFHCALVQMVLKE